MEEDKSPEDIEWERATRASRWKSNAVVAGISVVCVVVAYIGYVLSHLGGFFRF